MTDHDHDHDHHHDENNNWHLDKKVPVSIIVVLVAYLVGGLWFLSKVESRVAAVEMYQATQNAAQIRIDDRQDREATASLLLTRESLKSLNDKLDRLIETSRK